MANNEINFETMDVETILSRLEVGDRFKGTFKNQMYDIKPNVVCEVIPSRDDGKCRISLFYETEDMINRTCDLYLEEFLSDINFTGWIRGEYQNNEEEYVLKGL